MTATLEQPVFTAIAKHPGGQPTLYKPEYCAMLVEWFQERAQCTMRTLPDASQSEQVKAVCSEVPTFAGFANSIGVSVATLDNWGKRHPEFFEARARCKAIIEQWFSVALTTGAANPTGAIFVAKNILGWRDKTEVETVTRNEDSDATLALKEAAARATPAQLEQLSTLLQAMMANPSPNNP